MKRFTDPKLIEGTFVREPRGETYRRLIAILATMADRALFIERILHTHDGVVLGGFSPEGERLRLRLDPWCIVEEERSEWPGTRLLGGATVLVREYTLSSEVILVLQTSVAGLYEWQGGLPEGLALLREGGADMMFGISHEDDGAVTLYPAEWDRLFRECPGIARRPGMARPGRRPRHVVWGFQGALEQRRPLLSKRFAEEVMKMRSGGSKDDARLLTPNWSPRSTRP
jgi:hypothetical protein